MKLYNTPHRKLEPFTPQNPNNLKIYTCGPTVYSHQHIGNYAAYIYWDTLIRTLMQKGYKIHRILNITDVGHLSSDADAGEDKLEKSAKKEGKSPWEIAEYYTDDFLTNFSALGLIEPTKITKATDYIEADISLIEKLIQKGYTYEITDGIYYDTTKFPTYAAFAHLDLNNLRAGARVEYDPEKHHPADFALWKFVKPDEKHDMKWPTPKSLSPHAKAGYPGWHIECSAIIHAELGEPIDIHTGGIDHIPVHHTNEIAQSEAAFDVPLSRFWLHNNFLTIDGQKISKSLGNIYTFKDLAQKGFTHTDFRLWTLQGHYQSERNFTFTDLAAAHHRLTNYRNYAALRHQLPAPDDPDLIRAITAALENNLMTPEALSALDQHLSTPPTATTLAFLDATLGLDLIASTPDITPTQKALIKSREAARLAKNYQQSDALRADLEQQGLTILDTPTGPIWQYLA